MTEAKLGIGFRTTPEGLQVDFIENGKILLSLPENAALSVSRALQMGVAKVRSEPDYIADTSAPFTAVYSGQGELISTVLDHAAELPLARPWERAVLKEIFLLQHWLITEPVSQVDFCRRLRELAESLPLLWGDGI